MITALLTKYILPIVISEIMDNARERVKNPELKGATNDWFAETEEMLNDVAKVGIKRHKRR